MTKTWVRNEWVEGPDGTITRGAAALIDHPETAKEIDYIINAWTEHQWLFIGGDLIIGVPPVPGNYICVFSKQEVA